MLCLLACVRTVALLSVGDDELSESEARAGDELLTSSSECRIVSLVELKC